MANKKGSWNSHWYCGWLRIPAPPKGWLKPQQNTGIKLPSTNWWLGFRNHPQYQTWRFSCFTANVDFSWKHASSCRIEQFASSDMDLAMEYGNGISRVISCFPFPNHNQELKKGRPILWDGHSWMNKRWYRHDVGKPVLDVGMPRYPVLSTGRESDRIWFRMDQRCPRSFAIPINSSSTRTDWKLRLGNGGRVGFPTTASPKSIIPWFVCSTEQEVGLFSEAHHPLQGTSASGPSV